MKEFVTDQFESSHGRKPRGYGDWGFVPADGYWPKEIPADGIAWVNANYGEAKREVVRMHPQVDRWLVLS